MTTEFLLQRDVRETIIPSIGTEPWLTVYLQRNGPNERTGMSSALIPEEAVPDALSRSRWDLLITHGRPGTMTWYGAEPNTRYFRFGNEEGIEPIVLVRSFPGKYSSPPEVSEEFRHFHNLYSEPGTGRLLAFGDDGTEIPVGEVSDTEVRLRYREVAQFLAVRQLHLAIFFEFDRYSSVAPDAVDGANEECEHESPLVRYSFHVGRCDFSSDPTHQTFSRLYGKKLIEPPPWASDSAADFEDQQFEEFVIGVDVHSNPIRHTADPDELADFFGKNPDAPNYLTPVHFKRTVLAKYYANPERFTVGDGYVACEGFWHTRLDTDNEDQVIAYLGDLGSNLPHTEQVYWKSFNIPPVGGLSEVAFRRNFLAEFAEPERPDLRFRAEFSRLAGRWQSVTGWDLFLPLDPADAHYLQNVRIPLVEDQAEFDAQVLGLTKVVVDSLNTARLRVETGLNDGEGSIAVLEAYLLTGDVAEAAEHAAALRSLQSLRSTGVAHRKGQNYTRTAARAGLDKRTRTRVLTETITNLLSLLQALDGILCRAEGVPG